jgi:NADH-quinone oxidoreductase subunit E/NADP-reducing hydrogenase subunit HndA
MGNCCAKETGAGYEKLEAFIDSLPNKRGELIMVLHKAQEIFGFLPREVQAFIAEKMEVPLAKIYGVITFYSFFTMTPKGRHPISICMGTACYVRGADQIVEAFSEKLHIQPGQTTEDGKFSLDTLRCVGACGLAPVVLIGEKVYGRVTPDMVEGILGNYKD